MFLCLIFNCLSKPAQHLLLCYLQQQRSHFSLTEAWPWVYSAVQWLSQIQGWVAHVSTFPHHLTLSCVLNVFLLKATSLVCSAVIGVEQVNLLSCFSALEVKCRRIFAVAENGEEPGRKPPLPVSQPEVGQAVLQQRSRTELSCVLTYPSLF